MPLLVVIQPVSRLRTEMRKRILATTVGAAVAALALTSWLIAQPVTQNQITGLECWNSGQGPGGPSTGFICANLVRGGTAVSVLSAVSGNFTIGTTSGNFTNSSTPNMANLLTGGNLIINAQPSAAVITMPPNPFPDGSIIHICNGTNSAFVTNAVTVAANTNQTMVPTGASITLTTLAAASCVGYQWHQGLLSWFKVQ